MTTPLFVALIQSRILKFICISILLFFNISSSFAQHRSLLWGVSEQGGPQNAGYIFKYDISANTFTKDAGFSTHKTDATYFTEFFKADSNYLYAVKTQNDSVDKATIVRFNRKTNQLEKLYTFDPAFYSLISGPLTECNGKFYGLAYGGYVSPYNPVNGILFEWDPITNVVTNKVYFNSLGTTYGRWPRGKLFLYNNKLYGTATYGGINDDGALFEYDPITNIILKKADFTLAVTGRHPDSFLQLFNGKFYGICLVGGAASMGTLFEYDIATGVLKKALDLTAKPMHGKPVLINDKIYTSLLERPEILELDLTRKSMAMYMPYLNGFSAAGRSSPLYLHNGLLYGIAASSSLTNDSSYVYSWAPGSGFGTKIATIYLDTVGKDFEGPLTMVNDKLYAISENGSASNRVVLLKLIRLPKQRG
jgi:hypothetical protein